MVNQSHLEFDLREKSVKWGVGEAKRREEKVEKMVGTRRKNKRVRGSRGEGQGRQKDKFHP